MKNSCYDLKERITREIIYFVRRHRTFFYLNLFFERVAMNLLSRPRVRDLKLILVRGPRNARPGLSDQCLEVNLDEYFEDSFLIHGFIAGFFRPT